MKVYYENQGSSDRFCLKIGQDEKIDKVTLGMITHNSIPGLAPAVYTQINDERIVKYDITEKATLESFFESIMNKKKILAIFSSIIATLNGIGDYLLDIDSLLLDKRYVFINTHSLSTSVICSPVEVEPAERDSTAEVDAEQTAFDEFDGTSYDAELKAFFLDLLLSAKFDNKESGVYLKYLVYYLNGDIKFRLGRFSSLIKDLTAGNPITPEDYGFDEDEAKEVGIVDEGRNTYTIDFKSAPAPAAVNENVRKGFEVPGSQKSEEPDEDNDGKKEKSGIVDKFLGILSSDKNKGKKEKPSAKSILQKIADDVSATPAKPEKKANNHGFEIPSDSKFPVAPPPSKSAEDKEKNENSSAKPSHERKKKSSGYAADQPVNNGFGKTMYINTGASEQETDSRTMYGEKPYITHLRTGQSYLIYKEEYIIGRNKDEVDCLVDNAMVSRTHAKIINHNGVCEIVDLGSANKTYVNGFIVSGKPVTLQSGDRIKFSEEAFEFEYK